MANKLDLGTSLLILPYVLTFVWIIYGLTLGYEVLSKEMFTHIGKDPILFILSSLSFNIGFFLVVLGFSETNELKKIYPLAIVFTIIAIINLLVSLILASIISGGFGAGLSLLVESQFILMYNLIILIVSFILPIRFEKVIHIDRNMKSGLSILTLFLIYAVIRVMMGPSIFLLLFGLVGMLSILYIFYIR